MSTFVNRTYACPGCGEAIEASVVAGLNGAQRADQVEKILDGTFQKVQCEACGQEAQVTDPFVYQDFEKGHWFSVLPEEYEPGWERFDAETRRNFRRYFGPTAPPIAREIGAELRVRTVFGLPALREKLVAFGAGIDDACLEALKLSLMRATPELGLGASRRVRLVGVDDDALYFHRRDLEQVLSIARSHLDEIEADREAWKAALDAVGTGSYVDLGRLFLTGDVEEDLPATAFPPRTAPPEG